MDQDLLLVDSTVSPTISMSVSTVTAGSLIIEWKEVVIGAGGREGGGVSEGGLVGHDVQWQDEDLYWSRIRDI